MTLSRWLVVLAAAAVVSAPPARAAVMPTVASVFPKQGLAAGGTAVTITGTNFFTPMVVRFDGLNATSVAVVNETTITCLTPAHVAASVDVAVAPASDPLTLAATLPGAYTYLAAPPAYVWVPRAEGDAAGGYDVSIVDYANRREAGRIDLNGLAAPFSLLPGFPVLPGDDDWCVTQVLFDATASVAFVATAGRPGTADSGVVYIVSVPQAVGDQAGTGFLGALPTGGNPYQVALSSDSLTLYAADGGAWSSGTTTLVGRNGRVLSWSLAELASILGGGIPTSLPVPKSQEVGPLPMMAYARSSLFGWGTNSSFTGTILSLSGTTVVTNAFGNTLMKLKLSNLAIQGDSGGTSVSIGSAVPMTTTSIPSPFEDDMLFVETFERGAGAIKPRYFRYRISSGTVSAGREVDQAVRFNNAPSDDLPTLRSLQVLNGRTAWPYPGAAAMVVMPDGVENVATWDPAAGEARLSPAAPGTLPGGLPTSLAYNDATGFFYAREGDGGWTVLRVPPTPPADPDACPNGINPPEEEAPPLEVVTSIDDAEGADSLRVVGNGSSLVGAASSKLVVIEGRITAPADIHKVTGSPILLSLDPAGGPVFPQPGSSAGAARSFPSATGDSSTRVTGPILLAPLDAASLDSPPIFTGVFPEDGGLRFMAELGNQYDFLPVPGSLRVRIKRTPGGPSFQPTLSAWRRFLRTVAAGGNAERPFYVRLVGMDPRGRVRSSSPTVCFHVAAPPVPVLVFPDEDAALSAATPPSFQFTPGQEGTAWLVFTADSTEKRPYEWGRVKVPLTGAATEDFTVPPKAWKEITAAAKRSAAGKSPAPGLWTVEVKDVLGRTVPAAAPRTITVSQ